VSILDDEARVMEVVVEDRQLSLAIGKKGQNVRLAAKLTGWKIDIKSEEEKRKEVEAQLAGIDFGDTAVLSHPLSLPDIHDEVVAGLRAAGYDTVEKLLAASPEDLVTLPGFDAETVDAVLAAARLDMGDAAETPAEEHASGDDTDSAGASAEPEDDVTRSSES
jgi:N utilization substance protein A